MGHRCRELCAWPRIATPGPLTLRLALTSSEITLDNSYIIRSQKDLLFAGGSLCFHSLHPQTFVVFTAPIITNVYCTACKHGLLLKPLLLLGCSL